MNTQTTIHPSLKGIGIICSLCLLLALPAFAQTAAEDFQRAVVLERAEGDYAGAIALYERVVEESNDRDLTGRALIQLARAYENLGRDDAARTYQRVLSEFADMEALVAEARAGYARTREPVVEAVTEKEPLSREMLRVEYDFEAWGSSLSPSGHYLVGTSYNPPGVRYIELATGEESAFPIHEGEEGYGEYARFSPDETKIAVAWERPDGPSNLVIVDVGTGEHELVFDVLKYYQDERGLTMEYAGVHPHDWSPDGTAVLLSLHASDKPGNCCAWGEEFGILDLPTGQLQLFAGRDQMEGFGWDNACLSPDSRFVFADFSSVKPGAELSGLRFVRADVPRNYIRRFDLETGKTHTWRFSGGVDYELASCSRDPEQVLYVSGGIGSRLLRAAGYTDDKQDDDRIMSRVGEHTYMSLGSHDGDLISWESSERGLYVADADLERGVLLGPANRLLDEWIWDLEWSPGGEHLAWVSSANRTRVSVWSATGVEQEIDLPERVLSVSWLSEDRLQAAVRNPATDSTWSQRWDDYVVGVDDGSASKVLGAADASSLGLRGRWGRDGDRQLMWHAESGCLQWLGLASKEVSPWTCPGQDGSVDSGGRYGGVVTGPTRTGEPGLYSFRGWRTDDSWDVGTLRVGEDQPRIAHTYAGEDAVDVRGLSVEADGNLLVNLRSEGAMSAVERVNLATGERTRVLDDLLAQFNVRIFAFHPDSDKIAFFGVAKPTDRDSDAAYATIIHNALGDR